MSLKKNILANYLGAGWAALMNLAFVPLYIKYLGIEAYALIGIFAMLQGLLSLLDLGMAPTISREMARFQTVDEGSQPARNLLRSVETIAVCLAVVMGATLWGISSWLAKDWLVAKGLPTDVIAHAVVIMGGLIGLRIIENIYRSALIGLQRQVRLNLILVITATLRGLGVLAVLAYLENSVRAFFLWQLVASVASIVMLATATYSVLPKATARAVFSAHSLRSVGRFAAGTMAITCLSILLGNMDKILLSRLLPLEIYGYYAFAVVVAQTPLGFVAPIAQAYYPRFTQLHSQNNQAGLTIAYHSATQLVTVLLGAASAFLILFGRDVLEIWTNSVALSGRTYSLAAVLSVGTLFNGLVTIPYFLQLSSGWTTLTLRVNLFAVVLVAPALLVLVPQFGAMAAAWVWFALNTFYVIVVIPIMHRRLLPREKWRWYIQDVTCPLIAAFVTGLLLRSLFPMVTGRLQNLAALIFCALLLTLSAALSAPIVRRQMLGFFSGNSV